MSYAELMQRIENRQSSVGVLGMGYVGLPLLLSFCESGYSCVAFDIDVAKVDKLNKGQSYIQHIPSERIGQLLKKRLYRATTKPKDLASCDALIICVPTPLNSSREPDMTYVISTARTVASILRKDQLVTLESTTYPGTTRELLKPILEESGLKSGRDFYVAFSPEREDPGRKDYSTTTIPKVVGGLDAKSAKVAAALYRGVIEQVVPVSSCEVAEACKITENVYRSVNIALVNELKVTFDKMGIDVWEVIDAAATKPFGFQPFYPGPGLGGHCIPIDPFYLTWKARQYGQSTRFIELAGEINTSMPLYVVHKIGDALNVHQKAINGSRVLVLGLAYKNDIDDIRESPAIELIELLRSRGAHVDYNDPHVPRTHKQREHDLKMRSCDINAKMLQSYDCVVIATAHSTYDIAFIVEHAPLVVDTRNATKHLTQHRDKIVKA